MFPVLVIENTEPFLSEWLRAEYEHSALHWENDVWITNLKNKDIKKLKKTEIKNLKPLSKHCWEVVKRNNILILDPQGKKTIERDDLQWADFVIVGGILGDKVMKGRTKKEITDKFVEFTKNNDVKIVNLGKYHFPIDQAVIFCEKMIKNEKIEIVLNPEFVMENDDKIKRIVSLPYAYLKENDKILISKDLLNILKRGFSI